MLRNTDMKGLRWADKTKSMLHERALEACEDRLNDFPPCDPFDSMQDEEAENLWLLSYAFGEADEREDGRLHTAQSLRADVLERFREEAMLLSEEEYTLVQGLIVTGGVLALGDAEQGGAAESLLRRLWCHIEWNDDDTPVLHMGTELLRLAAHEFAQEAHKAFRVNLTYFDRSVRAMIYLNGCARADEMLHYFTMMMKDTPITHVELIWRYFHAAFDYTFNKEGDMILLHPGLAEPEEAMKRAGYMAPQYLPGNALTFYGAMSEMLPDEIGSAARMYGAIRGAIRPELTEEGAVEDLRMLVKQGVPLKDLQDVLGSMLIMKPTREMRDALRLLSVETPRWRGTRPQVLN